MSIKLEKINKFFKTELTKTENPIKDKQIQFVWSMKYYSFDQFLFFIISQICLILFAIPFVND